MLQKITLLFLLFTAAIRCHTPQAMQTKPVISFDKQGHRGCRGLLPENTTAAMLHAVDLHVTTLEMDAVFTKDGQVILSHEPFFNHEITTKRDGSFVAEAEERSLNIYTMTYAETMRYDVGLKPHPRFPRQQKLAANKPLLRDVIAAVKKHCTEANVSLPFFNIETKTTAATDNIYHPPPPAFVDGLMAVITEAGIRDKVIIQSFDVRTLQYLHQKFPAVKTAMLIEDFDKRTVEEQLAALGFTPTIYSPEQSLVNSAVVTKCHQHGMQIIPWTVNDTATMQRLINEGVDGLITDYPDLFAGVGK